MPSPEAVWESNRHDTPNGSRPIRPGNPRPRSLERKNQFVETGGVIEVVANRTLLVTFDRRSHNPILREAALDRDCRTIPWLSGYRVEFHYR